MAASQIFVLIFGTALIVFTLWFFLGDKAAATPAPQNGQTNGPIYACPMHPWITSTDPGGDCSVCGMKLIRREA